MHNSNTLKPTQKQPIKIKKKILPKSISKTKTKFKQKKNIPQTKQTKHKKPTKPTQPTTQTYKPITPPLKIKPKTKISTYKHTPTPKKTPKPITPPQKQPIHITPITTPITTPIPLPSITPKIQSKKKIQISDKTRIKPPSPPKYKIYFIKLHI